MKNEIELSETWQDRPAQSAAADRDRAALARVGKKEVMKRNFALLSMLGFGCIVLNTWEGILMLFALGYQNGGPSGLLYGYIVTWIGTLAIFVSLSELASMAPTSGGQYYWCAMIGPRKFRKGLSYVTGWLTVCGWQGALTSAFLLTGTMLQALVALNNPTYVPKAWHALLIMFAVTIFAAVFNTLISNFLPAIEGAILILHVVGFFAIMIPVVYLAPEHNSSEEVWQLFMNEGGWPTQGTSFCLGIISTVFIFLGADSVFHMAEEVKNAPVNVPRATIGSVLVNGFLGFGMLIGILYSLGSDLEGLLKTPYGYPFIQIFMNSCRSVAAATTLASLLLALIFFSTIGLIATSSRMIWSFSRDRGLPGWSFLSKVDPKSSIPVNAISVTCTISSLLLLISLGSTTALSAVISFTINSFYGSYFISAAILLYRRVKGDIKETATDVQDDDVSNNHVGTSLTWGPFHVRGLAGTLINAYACIWMIFVLFWSSWPTVTPVDATTMNYSVFITIFVAVASGVYYLVFAKKLYVGSIPEV
ncbi:choline transport protein [Polyplosphaeria fusca]|uniref:Choline transport protein n=1 Tax=Polyplosphaeria fusca TaxID=682080 RepID=A0A9P4UWR6_9PLEO|nr:choline transport protein [Polyplosphaeria fusca]